MSFGPHTGTGLFARRRRRMLAAGVLDRVSAAALGAWSNSRRMRGTWTVRQNLVLQSENLLLVGPWSNTAGAVTATADGDTWWTVTRVSGSSSSLNQGVATATPNDQAYTHCVELRAGSSANCFVGIYRGNWGQNADTTFEKMSGPGTLAQSQGGLISVTGLGAVPTKIRITRTTRATDTGTEVRLFIYPVDAGAATGSIKVRYPQVNVGATALPYVATTSAPITEGYCYLVRNDAGAQADIGFANVAIGADIVLGGGFSSTDTWTLGTGATISGGVLTMDASGAGVATSASQIGGPAIVAGQIYRVSYTITAVTTAGGGVSIQVGSRLTPGELAVGSYSYFVRAVDTAPIRVVKRAAANFAGSIDAIVVEPVTVTPSATGSDLDVDALLTHCGAGNGFRVIRYDQSGNGFHDSQATAGKQPMVVVSGAVICFPGGEPAARFDGTARASATPAINLSATNKVTVVQAARKLSDAGVGTLVELSAAGDGNNGAFFVRAPWVGVSSYDWLSRGTSSSRAGSPTAVSVAPHTAVLAGIGDISGDSAILRVNGVQAAANTADQGTGNFGNHALNFGARAGSSLYFNGLQGDTLLFPSLLSAGDLATIEDDINGRIKAWTPAPPPPSDPALLLEDGSNLLLEDGGRLLLDAA